MLLAPVLGPVVGIKDEGGSGHPGEEDALYSPVPPAAALDLAVHVERGHGYLPGHTGPGGTAQPAAGSDELTLDGPDEEDHVHEKNDHNPDKDDRAPDEDDQVPDEDDPVPEKGDHIADEDY